MGYTTDPNSAKRPYDDPPRLVVYGDIREITHGTTRNTILDSANSANTQSA